MKCRLETVKMGVPQATAGARTRVVLEQYVAGFEHRGRLEGRPYPLSQQMIHVI
jgi:hypothetical protein